MRFSNNPIRLLAEILAIIALIELAIMVLMPYIAAGLSPFVSGLMDLSLLVLLSGPLIYWRSMIITRNAAAAARPAGYVRTSASIRPAVVATALAQVSGLAITGMSVWFQTNNADHNAQISFSRAAERLESEVRRRLEVPLYGLTAVRGVYAASEDVTQAEFHELVQSLDMERQFAGVTAFTFVERVKRDDIPRYEARARAEGSTDFKVKSSGDAPEVYVVRHVEPLQENLPAWGVDVAREPARREALRRAVATGETSLSEPVTLLQKEAEGKALLITMPIFRLGADPQDERQREAALKGLVIAPIMVSKVLRGAMDSDADSVFMELFDGGIDGTGSSLFSSGLSNQELGNAPSFQSVRAIKLGGRQLNLRITSTPNFDAKIDRSAAAATALGGAFASFMLALAVWLLASGRIRANNLARRMTAQLDTMARVVQSTDNAVVITDQQLRITWVNEGFTQMSGYTLEEALGKTPGELLGTDQSDPETIARLAMSASAGIACRVELVNRAKDGRLYWIDTDVQPTFDDKGALAGFMEIGTDITEQKRAQLDLEIARRNLSDLADRLNLAVEGGNDGLWDWMDIASDVQWWSPSYYALLGYTPEELPATSASFMSIVHPDLADRVNETMELTLHHGKPYDQEMLLRTKHRGYRWFRSRAKVFRDAKGNATRMAGSAQDIHDRKQAEAEVERAGALLRGSIDALDDAFALFDPQDRLVLCNQRYIELHAQLLLDRTAEVTFSKILQFAAHSGTIKEAIGRESAWIEECMALHAQPYSTSQQIMSDGRVMRFTDTRMPDGHSVLFAVDITQLVKSKEAAVAASQSKSQFLANMSHEIRTPMNAILGMLRLLQNTELTVQQQDYAGKTEGAARSLLGLLNDILDFSKVEAGKMTLDPRPFRMDRLLRDLSVVLSSNVGNKTIEVLFDIDPQVPRNLVGDDMRLQQVLINLGGNAIKFTSVGEVVLRLRVLEHTADDVLVEFAVKDSGIGIAPENQAHIFSGFSQAEASTTRRFGGTGLGLAISSRLVGLLGGEMHLQSAPGVGSTFSFQLRMPLADAQEPAAPLALAPPQTTAQRTLIVDDNDIARDLLVTMARTLGWQVDAAESGARAVALLEQRLQQGDTYDVVFVDWQMPDMDGWQTNVLLREAMATQPGKPLPMVFIVTAHGRDMLAQRSVQEQATLSGFLVKPVTASMLLDAVMDGKSAALTAATGHNPAITGKPERPKRLQGMRILVVEDNKINQAVAQGLLSQEGAIVTLADNGRLGVDAIMTMQPAYDVVLMDLQMPVMDGFEATRSIRQSLGVTALPIIAMTANAMASDREACIAAGMNDHVGKPFELDHLVATLQRHTGFAMPSTVAKDAVPAVVQSHDFAPGDLDRDSAIARVGGNTEVYAKVLQAFAADMGRVPGQLATHLSTGDATQAARELHTLKGLAATVGARHLAQLAAQLEKKVKAGVDAAERADVVDELRSAIAALAVTLEPLLAQTPKSDPTASPTAAQLSTAERAQLHHDLRALAQLLKNSDMVAMEVFATVDKNFGPHFGETIEPLRIAMNSLEFEAAEAHCQKLLEELPQP